MKMKTIIISIIIFHSLCLVQCSKLHAQTYLGFYGGAGYTTGSEVNVYKSGVEESYTVDYTMSSLFGFRFITRRQGNSVIYYGMDLNISSFNGEGENGTNFKLNAVALTPMIFIRFHLLSNNEFPFGRLHPYLGAGCILYYGDASARYSYTYTDRVSFSSAGGVGVEGVCGLSLHISPKVAGFFEFRSALINVDVSDDNMFTEESVDTTIHTKRFVLGISLLIR